MTQLQTFAPTPDRGTLLSVRLSEPEMELLDREARIASLSRSELVRRALGRYVIAASKERTNT